MQKHDKDCELGDNWVECPACQENETTAPRVFSYLRVSGKGQIDGDGPDRQRDAIKLFCAGAGLDLAGEYFEKGVSGTIEGLDRPAFSEMLVAIESRRINGEEIAGIVVERLDRLARDLIVQELLLAECRKQNVKVFSADHGMLDVSNDGDPSRKLIRQIMGALAEWEKSVTVLKLRKARERKRALNGKCEGCRPYGRTVAEQQIVKWVEGVYTPEMLPSTLAKMLTEAGFRTRFNTEWNRKNIAWLIDRAKQGKEE